MPYKFETDKFKIPKDKDRRRKLTDEEREDIKYLYHSKKLTIREISRRYAGKCSHRLVQFVLFPERAQAVADNAKRKKAWLLYYDREKHNKAVKGMRRYKKELYKEIV